MSKFLKSLNNKDLKTLAGDRHRGKEFSREILRREKRIRKEAKTEDKKKAYLATRAIHAKEIGRLFIVLGNLWEQKASK